MTNLAAEHVANPRNRGPFEGYTHTGLVGEPGNGAFVQLWLQIQDGTIKRCHYATHGCMWSIACASVCAQMATGRPVEKALLMEPKDIDLVLGGIPEGKGEFADKSVRALRQALTVGTDKDSELKV